jgi:hypothetical protein
MANNKVSSFKLEKVPKTSILKKANEFFAWTNEALNDAEFTYVKDIHRGINEDKLNLRYPQLGNR